MTQVSRGTTMYRNFFKRVIDFTLSLLGLFFLSPLFLLIIVLIKLDSKGPIVFKQKRLGKDKQYFHIYKFRTMKIDTPKDMPTHLLENPDYFITRVGRILRKTSLDELPQLINILTGDMSIVGPRPCLWNQYDLIAERDKYDANNIRPGLTGLAQISGRDELEISKKAKFDGDYIDKMSLLFDTKVFITTFVKVFQSQGVVEGNVTTTKENGDK